MLMIKGSYWLKRYLGSILLHYEVQVQISTHVTFCDNQNNVTLRHDSMLLTKPLSKVQLYKLKDKVMVLIVVLNSPSPQPKFSYRGLSEYMLCIRSP